MFQVAINITANKWVPKIAENTFVFMIYLTREHSQIIVFQVIQNDFSVFMLPTQHIIYLFHSAFSFQTFTQSLCSLCGSKAKQGVFRELSCTIANSHLYRWVLYRCMCVCTFSADVYAVGCMVLTYTDSTLLCDSLGIVF